jgi:hypothetical protein
MAAALALGGLSAALAAQPATLEVSPGTRVRISAPSLGVRSAIGTLTSAGPDTIALTPERGGGGPMVLHRAAVTRFELSRGRRSRVVGGATWLLIGAPAGALGGGLLGFIDAFTDENTCGGGSRVECERVTDRRFGRKFSTGVAVGAVIGALAGAGYGIGRRAERWQTANLPMQLRVAVPTGLTVAIPFGRP